MGPPSYMRSAINQNVFMRRVTVLVTNYKSTLCKIPEEKSCHDY